MTNWLDALERPVPKVRVGKARKGAPTERTVQRDIIKALRSLGLRCIHIPNGVGLKGTPEERMRQGIARRRDGVVTGFPDLLIIKPGNPFARFGLLEVKREGGSLSQEQIICMANMERDGVAVAAVCTVEGALQTIREWWG